MLAPDILRQIRIVDEGVAVTLRLLDTVITVYLFLRNRILAVPFHEQNYRFLRQTVIARSGISAAEELITGSQIRLLPFDDRTHYSSGPVTFVLGFGFEHVSRTVHRLAG